MRNWNKLAKDMQQQQNSAVRYESGMTSEQKFHSITESVLASMGQQVQAAKGCPMHPKLSKKCRKCLQIEKTCKEKEEKQEMLLEETFPEVIKLNTHTCKTHFSDKLQRNIEDSHYYRTQAKQINTVKDLCNNLTSDEISIDAYMPGSSDQPTPFIATLYRLAELRPTREQLSIMLRNNNVNLRCLALLYLRIFADPAIVYGCLKPSFKDNKLLSTVTVGEYAMRLFDEEQLNHGGLRIPRLPIKFQREIQRRVAVIKAAREREFERERSRSRERQRKRQEQANQEKSESFQSQSDKEEQQEQEEKVEVKEEPKLSLKERIRAIQEKNEAQRRRRALLSSYQPQMAAQLDSEEEAKEQNDDVQTFKMG